MKPKMHKGRDASACESKANALKEKMKYVTVGLVVLSLLVMLSTSVVSAGCSSDTDCGSGYKCEDIQWKQDCYTGFDSYKCTGKTFKLCYHCYDVYTGVCKKLPGTGYILHVNIPYLYKDDHAWWRSQVNVKGPAGDTIASGVQVLNALCIGCLNSAYQASNAIDRGDYLETGGRIALNTPVNPLKYLKYGTKPKVISKSGKPSRQTTLGEHAPEQTKLPIAITETKKYGTKPKVISKSGKPSRQTTLGEHAPEQTKLPQFMKETNTKKAEIVGEFIGKEAVKNEIKSRLFDSRSDGAVLVDAPRSIGKVNTEGAILREKTRAVKPIEGAILREKTRAVKPIEGAILREKTRAVKPIEGAILREKTRAVKPIEGAILREKTRAVKPIEGAILREKTRAVKPIEGAITCQEKWLDSYRCWLGENGDSYKKWQYSDCHTGYIKYDDCTNKGGCNPSTGECKAG